MQAVKSKGHGKIMIREKQYDKQNKQDKTISKTWETRNRIKTKDTS